ncbi:MAG: hypothetical protein KGP14_00960 [Betaproteobacteria bacterium]|nr:hypothetical protein [Betaproteobacteria bacterium]
MSSGIITGNIASFGVASVTLSPAQVAANTTAEQTFTVPGLRTSDVIVEVSKPTQQAGLAIGGSRVSAANTMAVTFINATAGAITPTASETYQVVWCRPDATLAGVSP